jgi:hypothetical protein
MKRLLDIYHHLQMAPIMRLYSLQAQISFLFFEFQSHGLCIRFAENW